MNLDDAGGGLRGLRASQSTELIAAVCNAYGFSDVGYCIDLGGSSSLNLLIEVENRRYVVRVYRPYVTKTRLEDIQQVRRQLIAGGVPCSEILFTQHERPWISYNDRLVEIENYVDHEVYMDTWERLESALPMLGQIHTILHDVSTSQEGKYPMFANYIEPKGLLNRTLCGTQRVRGWDSLPFAPHLADIADELAYLVTTVGYDHITMLPNQLVHGDYWHNNVLFQDGDIVLITDFDYMGERTRINDLALTLYFTSLEYPEKPVSDGQLTKLSRLVDAYDSGLSDHLTSAERAALPFVLASQPLWSIGGWVANLDDEATAQLHAGGTLWAVDWALEIVRQLDRWQTIFA